MNFIFGFVILAVLLYTWWLYSTKQVITERHDWLQQQLDIRKIEKAALLDILAHRSFILKFTDMKDDVALGAIKKRMDERLALDDIFKRMLTVAEEAEITDAPTEWRKKWIE